MLSIRNASADDLQLIIQLITDLADYEKLRHEIAIDPKRLKRELFGDQPAAYAMIAQWNEKPVGFALFFYNFSTFLGKRGIYVEDVYVQPDYRGKGIGKALFRAIAQKAVAEDCGRVEWQVLDWNKPSIDFYEAMEARHKKEWLTYQLTGGALKRLANG